MKTRRLFFKQSIGTIALLAGYRPATAGGLLVGDSTRGFDLRPEAEEKLYQFVSANNGAGPMWGNGMTTVVRIGTDVFASGLETVAEVKGLSNCRWMLFKRYKSGWKLEAKDPVNLTREPASLAVYDHQRLLMTVNPKQADACTEYCLTHPEILSFDKENPHHPSARIIPEWKNNPGFNDHSYRSFSVDRQGKEMILFQNYMYHHAEWSFRDKTGRWVASDALRWPVETYGGKEVPLRLCYSNVAIKNRKVFFFANADVVEPVEEWKAHKLAVSGSKWDYVFRRLFFSWSDDITKGKFHSWIEIANRDKTAGNMRNQDLWLDAKGNVHLLWTEMAIDERLRDKFFPEEKQERFLNYAVLTEGKIRTKTSLLRSREGDRDTFIPGQARFQATPDGRLFVVYYVGGRREDGSRVSENRLVEVKGDGTPGPAKLIPFRQPFTSFQTANERAGCTPSFQLDMLGVQEGNENTISYACVRIV